MTPANTPHTFHWDEGKGKVVDILAEHAHVVVRYCGGANAGHGVKIGNEKYATHLLPVGIFRPGVMNLIGNGVVIDPATLFKEIDGPQAPRFRLALAGRVLVHVVRHHQVRLVADPQVLRGYGNAAADEITRRGIGPTYADTYEALGFGGLDQLI